MSKNVSIPIGFSSSLQLACRLGCNYSDRLVSIPIGFSSSLQHQLSFFASKSNRCFNPYRVFKFVATHAIMPVEFDVLDVSIPIGFSSSLQPGVGTVTTQVRD